MVYVITRWEHSYTTSGPRDVCKNFKHLSYDQLFNKEKLPMATYLFTDLDRLSVFELELAGIIYRELLDSGAVAYNDPASCLMRFELLKALHREKVNDFKVYQPQYQEWPDVYPVFLRRSAFHMGMLTDLLYSREELEEALQSAVNSGIPMNNIMAVGYAAEAEEDGVFRKFSVHKIGASCFQDTAVSEKSWVVKYGEKGVAGEEFYLKELEEINDVPFRESVEKVFDVSNIECGRVDIGLFRGRPQFYEINTNPMISFKVGHPSKSRNASRSAFVQNYIEAINSIDTVTAGGKITLKNRYLKKLRRRCRKRIRWYHGLKSRPTY